MRKTFKCLVQFVIVACSQTIFRPHDSAFLIRFDIDPSIGHMKMALNKSELPYLFEHDLKFVPVQISYFTSSTCLLPHLFTINEKKIYKSKHISKF